MAIKINKTIDTFGTSIEIDLYVKIESLGGNKDNINLYVDCKRFDNREVLIESKQYSFTPSVDDSSSNFIKQGYEYLKTLEEYQNAVDC